MKDFDSRIFKKLISSLKNNNYSFSTSLFLDQFNNSRYIILRHDVDRLPQNALQMAITEKEFEITGIYYFRIVPESFDKEIIKKIANLGHEVGYHYEEMSVANGNKEKAIKMFGENLKKIRKIYPVKTICMHGSPLSKFDNHSIWDTISYKDFGIIFEPYLDVDWNEFAYFTDTGRRWNSSDINIRDKVNSKYKFNFKSTFDIMNNVEKLPDKIIFTIHPERWNDNFIPWMKELIIQNVKNVVKKYFFVKSSEG